MNKEPELVDLGLPSGNLWMTHNLGAIDKTGLGLYYQFGSLKGYQGYEAQRHSTWKTCPFNNRKDIFNDEYFKANRSKWLYKNGLLKPEYDIVTQTYGENFKIPTDIDFQELLDNTTWRNNYKGIGVNGILFTSKINGNTMFIPFSGRVCYGRFNGVGKRCYLWSCKFNSRYLDNAYCFYCDDFDFAFLINNNYRCLGFTIRGIKEG